MFDSLKCSCVFPLLWLDCKNPASCSFPLSPHEAITRQIAATKCWLLVPEWIVALENFGKGFLYCHSSSIAVVFFLN